MAPSTTSSSRRTVLQALKDLEVSSINFFDSCETRDDEFKRLRKQFHKAALRHHPDKGGDPSIFRNVKTSYDLIQDLHTGKQKVPRRRGVLGEWFFSEFIGGAETKTPGKPSTTAVPDEASFDMSAYFRDFRNTEAPSWEYYQDAAKEELPTYRVERAKSGRSKCTATGKAKKCALRPETAEENVTALLDLSTPFERIAKDELRVGWLNEQTGSYGGWRHIRCWRVPAKLWEGLPDPDTISDTEVLNTKLHAALLTLSDCVLSGYEELTITDQDHLIEHLRDKANWAILRKKSRKAQSLHLTEEVTTNTPEEVAAAVRSNTGTAKNSPTSTNTNDSLALHHGSSLVSGRQRFVTPQPGINGCSDATVFHGKRFCLTGLFPEIGGGAGLSLGKDRVKAMIESFGGRVTQSISGKTDVLLVGKEPGMSKVTKARTHPKIKMGSLKDLKDGLDAGARSLDDFEFFQRKEPMKIQSFSAGYQFASTIDFNGLALRASQQELAIAQGFVPNTKPEPGTKGSTEGSEPTRLEGMEINDDRKPAAKWSSREKRKKTSDNAISEKIINKKSKNEEEGGGTEVTKSSQESSTAVTTMDSKKDFLANEDDDSSMEDAVACDVCGVDCTEESWYSPEYAADYCPSCYQKGSLGTRVVMEHQRHGETIGAARK